MSKQVSRLAPSPTGALHLGNARTFLINWALARRNGWSLVMRMEDLDGPRVRADAAQGALDTLNWLGLDYDGDILFQSADLQPYRDAMAALADRKAVFSCSLNRSDIKRAASAPHADDHELHYPASLRPDRSDTDRWRFKPDQLSDGENFRFAVPDASISIDDAFAGSHAYRPCDQCGDFIVWTKRDEPAYQLAVVVDDHRQGVTDVVRGDDLLSSAARQTLIYHCLGWTPPRWWHVPLVVGPDGRRLAKRHGDTRIEQYRAQGVPPQRIIGLLAQWCGVTQEREPMDCATFADRFEIDRLSRQTVVMTEQDDRWLCTGE